MESINKKLLIFDLDGTLIDSSGDIAWASNRTLDEMGHPRQDHESIKNKVGWGIQMLLKQLMPDEGAERLLEARSIFLRLYASHMIDDTTLYDGVHDTLDSYRAVGKRMAIVSNKPIELTIGVLKGFNMDSLFDEVLGGDSLPQRKPDPAPILHVLKRLGLTATDAVFVGDSPIDCEAGKAAGVMTVGAAFGFRPLYELEKAAPDFIIDSFRELSEIIS